MNIWANDIGKDILKYVQDEAPTDTLEVMMFGFRALDMQFEDLIQRGMCDLKTQEMEMVLEMVG